MVKKDSRIWEIDALRGLCIPGMIAIHLIYDVVNLYGFVHWPYPAWYALFKNNYGALFLLISGVSVTLGRRSVRRGITVFLSGMLVTAVTVGMYLLGMAGKEIIIYFGVLHCLGGCRMHWPGLKKLSTGQLLSLGICLVLLGWYLRRVTFDVPAVLRPLGLRFPGFSSSDYFPLMPNLGYFLLGAAFGRRFCGRSSNPPSGACSGPPAGRSATAPRPPGAAGPKNSRPTLPGPKAGWAGTHSPCRQWPDWKKQNKAIRSVSVTWGSSLSK